MSQLGFKSVVYHREVYLGEAVTVPANDRNFKFPNNEIRIWQFSPSGERCHPLSVLQMISPATVCCKLEPCSDGNSSPALMNLYASCTKELKTAVVLLGNEEVHLVAMPSKQKRLPCFWCYSVPIGVYNSSLWMLNTYCLALVFDLDQTLVVSNTKKIFKNKIEALTGKIACETDPIRASRMIAEMKRYVEDRALLKQYAERNCVLDGGKVYKAQKEKVPLSDGNLHVFRPVIRLPEKDIVLTRIHPENPDTSVLVRLRPAWKDLKECLRERGRKKFDVYVCTMSEREYALEMWRLLDPEAQLISQKQLLERVVCVKSGAMKSLLNVFQNGNLNMAMVIDDRLDVWEDKDQPRVHVVSAFTPYYDPNAEIGNCDPVLRDARNVICNARCRFFCEFKENILRKTSDIFYEDEVVNLPCSPDASSFLTSEINFGNDNQMQSPMQHRSEVKSDGEKANPLHSFIGLLQEIGRRCRREVEFRPIVGISDDSQFSVEVFFGGEKLGVGMGMTRKDAQQQAAEIALRCLAGRVYG